MTPPRQRLLIFIVAYNAETTLLQVLERIPAALFDTYDAEVLVIDDASADATFEVGHARSKTWAHGRITVLANPTNQGYGGNQKLGYEYAIQRGYDFVALLHGDGQYAPEKLPELVEPLAAGRADAVFGSRMMRPLNALKGGMPLYKFVGNRILTTFQNRVLDAELTEFHSGFRAYSVAALDQLPFRYNSNDFHFDTDIIIQFLMAGKRVHEIEMPTYYGDEVCYVNGMKYARDVVTSTLLSRAHRYGLKYQRKFDVPTGQVHYDVKLGYTSSHTLAIEAVPPGSRVLDLGCGPGLVAAELRKKGCTVVGVDRSPPVDGSVDEFVRWDLDGDELPVDVSGFDVVLLLDIIEHIVEPERFLEALRRSAAGARPMVILTTGNVTFALPRLMVALGQFNYGSAGILDRTHTRLFTFDSIVDALEQSGYELASLRGVPAPFPKALGTSGLGGALLRGNELAMRLRRNLFSYQMMAVARPLPTVESLLGDALAHSSTRAGAV